MCGLVFVLVEAVSRNANWYDVGMDCVECGERVSLPSRGRTGKYCSGRCRQAAYRRRQRDKARRGVPGWLREGVRWTRADGKRPVMVDGRAASSTDPATWGRFSDVQAGAGDGYGVMLGGGLACIDLDNCFWYGELSPFAQRIVEMNAGAYVEVSVSGNGLLSFGEFSEVSGIRRDGFEFYSRSRFIRVTGNVFRGMCGAGGVVPLNVPRNGR